MSPPTGVHNPLTVYRLSTKHFRGFLYTPLNQRCRPINRLQALEDIDIIIMKCQQDLCSDQSRLAHIPGYPSSHSFALEEMTKRKENMYALENTRPGEWGGSGERIERGSYLQWIEGCVVLFSISPPPSLTWMSVHVMEPGSLRVNKYARRQSATSNQKALIAPVGGWCSHI